MFVFILVVILTYGPIRSGMTYDINFYILIEIRMTTSDSNCFKFNNNNNFVVLYLNN